MGMRNYCAGYYDEQTGKINFWIQAEKEVGVKGTMGYLVDVPKLLFGQAGYHLSNQSKRQVLNDLYQPSQQPPFLGAPQGGHHHRPFHRQDSDSEGGHFQRLQNKIGDKIGGFMMMPQANN
jgi:hypothetical protein